MSLFIAEKYIYIYKTFSYLFTCWWTSRLIPFPSSCVYTIQYSIVAVHMNAQMSLQQNMVMRWAEVELGHIAVLF